MEKLRVQSVPLPSFNTLLNATNKHGTIRGRTLWIGEQTRIKPSFDLFYNIIFQYLNVFFAFYNIQRLDYL